MGGANTRVVHASLVSRNLETNNWVGQGLNLEINITTEYGDAWSDFFTETLHSDGFTQVGAGISPSSPGDFAVRLTTYGVWVEIADVDALIEVIDAKLVLSQHRLHLRQTVFVVEGKDRLVPRESAWYHRIKPGSAL